jgi:hypothetical protein
MGNDTIETDEKGNEYLITLTLCDIEKIQEFGFETWFQERMNCHEI